MTRISWGWRIIIAMVIFMTGTASWVAYAMSHDVDLVREDYYEFGLKHDETIAAQSRARTLGSGVLVQFASSSLEIQLPKTGDTKGNVSFYRPNAKQSDRTIALTLDPSGHMSIPTSQLARGVWHTTLNWESAGTTYQLERTDTLR